MVVGVANLFLGQFIGIKESNYSSIKSECDTVLCGLGALGRVLPPVEVHFRCARISRIGMFHRNFQYTLLSLK